MKAWDRSDEFKQVWAEVEGRVRRIALILQSAQSAQERESLKEEVRRLLEGQDVALTELIRDMLRKQGIEL